MEGAAQTFKEVAISIDTLDGIEDKKVSLENRTKKYVENTLKKIQL